MGEHDPVMVSSRRRFALASLAIAFVLVLPGCSVTLTGTVGPRSGPTPTPVPTVVPGATLAAVEASDIGPGTWVAITTDTNASSIPRIEGLGNVQRGYGYVLSCSGTGQARLSISASTSAMVAARATPIPVVSIVYQCPITESFSDATNAFDGGTFSLSPDVNAAEGVVYRLVIGTHPG